MMTACTTFALTLPVSGFAGPIATSGDGVVIGAPPSVTQGSLVKPGKIFAFFEGVSRFKAPLAVDISSPGTYTLATLPGASALPGGMEVASYYLHMDSGGPFSKASAKFGFENEILGIIVTASNLDKSDFLGASGTDYPTGVSHRGWEKTFDSLELDSGLRTLAVNLAVSTGIDNIRVITRTPEPSTYGVLGLFLIAAFAMKKRQAASLS